MNNLTGGHRGDVGTETARRRRQAARKFFNLSERYDRYREYRVDPLGRGLHGMHIAAGEVIRLTQTEVEQHPAWEAFGTQAGSHPPLRGWLATPVCSEDADRRPYGLLQLSDKTDGQEFSPDDATRLWSSRPSPARRSDALRHAVAQSLDARR
jgi:hypothetical protein